MPYEQEISRQHPVLCVILLDQSATMEEPAVGANVAGRRKMDQIASAVDSLLWDLVIRLTGLGGTKYYFDFAVIGYRTDHEANPIIESAFGGELGRISQRENRMVFSIPEIAEFPSGMATRMRTYYDEESGESKSVEEKVPTWLVPKAEGGTPMCTALYRVYEIIDRWIAVPGHEQSFPPIVLHVTDGESSEGDPLPYAGPIMDLETQDGRVLLFNCCLSNGSTDPIVFPSIEETLPDEYSRLLFRMTSPFPKSLFQAAEAQGFNLQPGARGLAINCEVLAVVKFLDFGRKISRLPIR